MEKHTGILLDVSYSFNEKKESFLSLCVKTKKGKEFFFERSFFPYFYVLVDDAKKRLPEIQSHVFEKKFSVRHAAIEKKLNAENVLRLSFNNTEELREAREEVKKFSFVLERREYDIPFTKRYLLDTGLAPMNGVIIETKNGSDIENAKPFDADEKEITGLSMVSFDLETHSPGRFSNPLKDPIISIAVTAGEKEFVFAWRQDKKKDAHVFFESEKKVVEEFVSQMEKTSPDIVVTYNGDSFDFPYLEQRCKKLGVELKRAFFGQEPRLKRMGLDSAYRINGVQHLDAYKVIRIMNRFGVVSLVKFDLESVSDAIFGVNKKKVDHNDINLAWETGMGMKEVIDYNKEDATYTYKIAQRYLLLYAELCRLSHETLFEASRSGASSLVEDRLMRKAFELSSLVPNRPEEGEVKKRMLQSFKGGYVKEPLPGLHENIAVLDFRSLHPSIMISHNVSPETLRCSHQECMDGKNVSPDHDWFCMKHKGFIPIVLEEILEKRVEAKKAMKKTAPTDPAHALFAAKQQALKILLNSHYGYLGYPRSRWYSRQCAKAITAWSRHYIQDINAKAEEQGFVGLYGDSITAERFVTIKNPQGFIEAKNIQELFEENKGKAIKEREKEFISLKGFEALSVNPLTFAAEWNPIKAVIRHKTGKKIYRVQQKFGETRATEDHSIITLQDGKLQETKPGEMAEKRFFSPKLIPSSKNIEVIDLFKELQNYSSKITYKGRTKISKVQADNECLWFGWTNQKNPIRLKRFIHAGSGEFNAMCRLLGAYIAEGSSSTIETTKSRFGASIASSNVKWLEELQADYNNLFNAKASIIRSTKSERTLTYNNGTAQKTVQYADLTCKLQMMNGVSAVFFKVFCGQKSHSKRLPNFIFNVPERYKLLLLEKMIEGDGSHSVNKRLGYSEEYIQNNFSYTTKSLGVASGLSLLLKQLGRNHIINYRPSKQCYELKTSTKHNKTLKTKIIEEKYEGFVYDLSVEENNNFVDSCGQVLLHNTDSCFLKVPKEKAKEDVLEFVKKINSELPGAMELEFEGYYKRGIFVTKREGGAAKKRYALLDFDGNLKIVGFEYVRRDWAKIAKDTQREVLQAVLELGSPQKAIDIVKEKIKRLREGKAEKKELVVLTQIKKPLKSYETIGPHVAAAKKAIARGKEIEVGSTVSFIITKNGKSISDRAELEEFVKEGNYDADYYIEHQLIPAVIRIISELGVSKEDLIHGGKQKSLEFFS
ncbi:MAG: DNA polymerase domain-containing protein [archaeon]|nr:DNA polymerase domain-containing protein [archaeon]